QQATKNRRHHNELADRRAVVVIQTLIQRDQRLLAQRSEVGEQAVQAAFELLGLEFDAAAKYAVIKDFQLGIEVFEAVMVLTGPSLQGTGQTCFQKRGGFRQLLTG